MVDEPEDEREYVVVMNDEEQYSIWLADRPLPDGWKASDYRAKRAECLSHIDEVWTDMRPLSLRRQMEQAAGRQPS